MEVGDSFFIKVDSGKGRHSGHVTNANKRYFPNRYIGRQVDGGIRVWRVE